MAAPIAHIFCALALITSGTIQVDDMRAFIIGTSFPDIRYLGVVERETTHVHNVTWNDVLNAPTSFLQGLLLHSLLDEKRESFVEEHELYAALNTKKFSTQVLKLYEDMQLYSRVDDWPQIITYFDTILPEEQTYGITTKDIEIWHALLQTYCAQQPTIEAIEFFLQQRTALTLKNEPSAFKAFYIQWSGWLKNKAALFILKNSLEKLEKQKKVKKCMNHFYDNVVQFLSTQ